MQAQLQACDKCAEACMFIQTQEQHRVTELCSPACSYLNLCISYHGLHHRYRWYGQNKEHSSLPLYLVDLQDVQWAVSK